MNEENIMDKDKFVAELIANEGTKFEESDSKWLNELEDEQLERLVPAEVKKEEVKTNEKSDLKKVVDLKVSEGEKVKVTPTKPQTLEEYVADAPGPMQEVLNSGIRAFNSRKTELITSIKANEKNKFSDEVLNKFDLQTLENLASLAVTEDYTLKGGPRFNEEDPNAVPMPEPVFDLSPKSNGAAKE